MQYRHSFHAGNFADVHKHIALLQLIGALQKKAKGFQFLDTHAGEGLYDLAGPEARRSAESDAGIARLEQRLAPVSGGVHNAIRHYMDAVQRIRRAYGNARHLFPGSPLLAAAQLREADLAVCVESQPQVARALQRSFEHGAALLASVPRVLTGDGYHEVSSQLPPPLRRGLTLIDPPYESADEERHLTEALSAGLERFETGVFAIWYPIKKRHDSDLWLARVMRGVERPALAAELCLSPPDHAAGLNGSGMLVVNPPWQFDSDAAQWQAELHELLGGSAGGTVRWLVHEQ
jgi:23S rRNA (adenine2030-N6)-methyltransferase